MADRYDWDRERDWDRDRDREHLGARTDWSRGRGPDGERSQWERPEWRRGREQWGREREESNRPDWRNERHEPERTAEYGGPGDFGNQGIWGSQANRFDWGRTDWNWDQGWRGSRGNSGGPASYRGGTGSYGGGMGQYGQRGRFAGRGPKGWSRSDDRIREDINERLTDHPEVDASEIEVQVKAGEVTLTGIVEERQAKRIAEDIAENVSGVKDVHNQIRVQPNHQMSSESSEFSSSESRERSRGGR